MKIASLLVGVLVLLCGCSSGNRELERGMALRSALLEAEECSFDAKITADYGDKLYTFSVNCRGNAQGDLDFTVTGPESISGITGTITDAGGLLTFEDKAMQFDAMAEGQVTPVTAPWIFLKTLRSGYLNTAGMEEELLRLTIDDSYAEDALQLDIWMDQEDRPLRGEILHKGRRIVTLEVDNFEIR